MAKVEVDIWQDDSDGGEYKAGTSIVETNGIAVIPCGGCYTQFHKIAAIGWGVDHYITNDAAYRIMDIQRSEIQNPERIK